MAIVSFEVDLKPRNITWEQNLAELALIPEIPESKINYSDIPKLTEERAAKMRPFWEILKERRAQKAAKAKQTTTV